VRLQSIFLILAVVLSGCVGQPTASTTAGVIIKGFAANPPEAEFGSLVFFTATIKNVGEQEATNVLVKLIGLTDEWTKEAQGESRIDDQWRSGAKLAGAETDKLFPAIPARGFTEGEEVFKEWKAFPPQKDVELSYGVTARLEYNYQTVSESLIRIVSISYFRQTNNAGGLIDSKTSGGPFVVGVFPTSTVIGERSSKMTLQIEVRNVGGGKASFNTAIDSVNVNTFSRLVGDSSKNFKIDGCSKTVKLVDSKVGRIICEVTLPEPSPYIDMPLVVKVDYKYFVDNTIQVKVLPKRGT